MNRDNGDDDEGNNDERKDREYRRYDTEGKKERRKEHDNIGFLALSKNKNKTNKKNLTKKDDRSHNCTGEERKNKNKEQRKKKKHEDERIQKKNTKKNTGKNRLWTLLSLS